MTHLPSSAGTQEDYQIALDAGVEDGSFVRTRAVRFNITSYGADYTVDTLTAVNLKPSMCHTSTPLRVVPATCLSLYR